MILPIELLDVVVHLLKDDRESLRSLSLTHRTITPFAQQQLFRHISLGCEIDDVDNDDSIFKAFTDKRHSHLLPYIHSLTLRNNIHNPSRRHITNAGYTPNPLAPGFVDQIAPQLTSLNLIDFAPGWDHHNAIPLRASITSLLSSPNLTHLGLDGVNLFTMALLTHCSSLKSFRFSTPYPSYTNGQPITTDPVNLEILDLHFWGELPAMAFISWLFGDHSRFSIARLRTLKITGGCTRAVANRLRELLALCGSTLQHLSLGPAACDFGPSPLCPLLSLRTINFAFEMTYCPAPLDGIPRLVNSGGTPFNTLISFLSPGSAFLPGNNSLAHINLHCHLSLLDNMSPPVQVQFNSATGKAEIVQQSPIKYEIYAAYFDNLVDILMEGKMSGRLAALRTVKVRISLVVITGSTGQRKEACAGYEDFVDAFRGRFVSIIRDGVGLEFYQVL